MRDDTKLNILWEEMEGVEKITTEVAPLIPKIPKDYSTTETDTGLKWIDDKSVYRIVLTGNTPSDEQASITLPLTFDNLVEVDGIVISIENEHYPINRLFNIHGNAAKTGIIIVKVTNASFQNVPYELVIYYTKPTATREPDDEPETKKATKKKTTKNKED